MTPTLKKIPVPKGRLFAVGDIHGCCAELKSLMGTLDFDSKLDQLIFIGDYVDRGLDSRGVIDYLISVKEIAPNTIFLKGNHEDMMLDYLGLGGNHGNCWIRNGGDTTLNNYFNKKSNIQKEHIEFLKSLDTYVQCGNFIFAHAGLSPFDPIDEQDIDDLLWIREPFLQSKVPFENITVVHGHTPFYQHTDSNKINLDTGCVFGGKLTCIECFSRVVIEVKSNYDYRNKL